MSGLKEVRESVENGKSKTIAEQVETALKEGNSANAILAEMINAMDTVGDKFSAGEIFVPEMLVAARTMAKGVNVLEPLLAQEGSTSLGKCIIGTVAGDLHDIGKNLVTMMIKSAGFEMIDLGIDVPIDTFINAIKENPDVKVVALSALLTTTMPAMKETVAALKNAQPGSYKILVGGAPVTQAFADEIGADAYAPDAGSAAVKAKSLI